MKIDEVKIVQIGVGIEIRITVNGIRFYTHCNFDTEAEAREMLKIHGMKEKTL